MKMVRTRILRKVMVLSPHGDLWATTEDEFKLFDIEQMEKIRTIYINNGNCYGDCVCVTKGIPIGDNHYRLLKYDNDLRILNLENAMIAMRNKVCIIGEKDPKCLDPIPLVGGIADELDSCL